MVARAKHSGTAGAAVEDRAGGGRGARKDEIAAELKWTRWTVGIWRNRFVEQRLAGIEQDEPRGGRTPTKRAAFEAEIIRRIRTTQETPLRATKWSTRPLARAIGCNGTLVHRVWHDNGLKLHWTRTFQVSNDPKFTEKLVDIVGLYLDPPEHALVLSCDETSQIQTLDCTQKSLPLFPGRLKTLTPDYKRHCTTALFAAVDLAEEKIITDCHSRHRHSDWLKFLKKYRQDESHKHPTVRKWLKKHLRFHQHFTPTNSSWLRSCLALLKTSVATKHRLML